MQARSIAFSSSPDVRIKQTASNQRYEPQPIKTVSNDAMSPLFLAVVEATEEAIYNSLFKATTMTGKNRTIESLPLDRTIEILRKHGLLVPGK